MMYNKLEKKLSEVKVSLITVCYNSEKTLEETIQSVLNQKYKNLEHIIIDGGSSDNTLKIIQKYEDHFSHIVSEPDEGIYDAMNKGIKLATGEIVGILNSDDVYAHDNVIKVVNNRMQLNSLDVIYADLVYFRTEQPDKIVRKFCSKYFNPKRLCYGITVAHPTLFVRQNIYNRFGVFQTKYKIAGDFDFIARIFSSGAIKSEYLPEIFVKMRLGGASTNGLNNLIIHNQELIEACRASGIKTNLFKISARYFLKLVELTRA